MQRYLKNRKDLYNRSIQMVEQDLLTQDNRLVHLQRHLNREELLREEQLYSVQLLLNKIVQNKLLHRQNTQALKQRKIALEDFNCIFMLMILNLRLIL